MHLFSEPQSAPGKFGMMIQSLLAVETVDFNINVQPVASEDDPLSLGNQVHLVLEALISTLEKRSLTW